MDYKLERLMKQLGEAINDSVSDSEQVADVISRIKSSGYEVFVVLEATVGFHSSNGSGDEPLTAAPIRQGDPEWSISSEDAQFLKSLKISVEPRPGRNREKAA